MTQREFYTAIVNGTFTNEIQAFATEQIAKLDKRNSKRATTPSKTAIANAPLKRKIVDILTEFEDMTAAELKNQLGVTVQKASALCVQMVKEGTLTATEVKIPKKGKVKAYSLAVDEDGEPIGETADEAAEVTDETADENN